MKRLFTLFFGFAILSNVSAQTIWNSGSYTFTKTAPFQQDCITSGVCLTRGSNSVIYNEVTEDYLDGDGNCNWTPGNTTWAYGDIANWNTLTYQNLYVLNGCTPPSMVNQPMVLHIMPDNIYLQLTFTSWAGGGSGGNYIYTRTTQTPLGVKLKNFQVKENNGVCTLDWSTASEKNNKGFYIERSSDAQNFETIDFITAKGNSESESIYTYTDVKPNSGSNYYRLKQVDFDGTTEYSWVVNATVKSSTVNIYPNPATNTIHLEVSESQSGSWKLSNAMGFSLKKGNLTEKEINISDLSSGMYILTITNGKNVTVKNIVKL